MMRCMCYGMLLAYCLLFHPFVAQGVAGSLITSGAIQVLNSPPASVVIGDLESDTDTFVFLERTGLTLPSNLEVNIVEPGFYTGPSVDNVHLLPGGNLVDSYFVHFDPVGARTSSDPAVFSEGTLTFERKVIAIITRDWPL